MLTSIQQLSTNPSDHLDQGIILQDKKEKISFSPRIEEEKTFFENFILERRKSG